MAKEQPRGQATMEEVSRSVTLTEIKTLLERELAERGDLTYEQKLALEQATIFARVSEETAARMMDELRAIPKLNDFQRAKIIDLAPAHVDDVKAIFQKDRLALEKDEMDKIVAIVAAAKE